MDGDAFDKCQVRRFSIPDADEHPSVNKRAPDDCTGTEDEQSGAVPLLAMPEPVELKSHWMSTASWDENTKELEIVLDDGHVYNYASVPASVYQGLVSASSAGKYFIANIKGRFAES